MTDNFKEIGSLFGREGAGAGFAKQTDKESFTYAFAWPEGDTWATLTGYLNLDEQPEEYVRRVLQDGGLRSDWGNPDYDPIGDFKETAGDEYRIPLLKVLLREQMESRYEVANHFSTMNRARVELFDLAACGVYSPYDALKVCDTPEIFLKTGFEQRPMLYTQKHLFQALTPKSDYNPHRHGFSIEQVKRFPELLASPVVLANSPTRDDVLLVILLATDAYDTPLIAGIKPDGTGNYGEREVETNMVLSVYSRQNFIRYFALLRDMDAFVFVSGKKIEALEDLSGLPLAGNCSGLDIDRILQRPKCLG